MPGSILTWLLNAIAAHGYSIRVNEESGLQVIWVATQEDADKVRKASGALARPYAKTGITAETANSTSPSALGGYFSATKSLKSIANAFLGLHPSRSWLILARAMVAIVSQLGADLSPAPRRFFFPKFCDCTGRAAGLSGYFLANK